MKNRISLIFIFSVYFSFNSFPQEISKESSILFYNVENLFDIIDNPITEDDNYTPRGDLHWTASKLNNKLLNISKVVLSAAGYNVPDIFALCEVENRYVLDKLLETTPLKTVPYKIIHKESPDHRGIEIAFFYHSENFYPLDYEFFPLMSKKDEVIKTREILYVSGILNELDTLHFFVNHWPSRYSGVLETRTERNLAATLLRTKIDELTEKYNSPKIIILGDFNDNPSDESISEILLAKQVNDSILSDDLYNLSFDWQDDENGTLKYQSQWFFFDQIIVSGSLLNAGEGYFTKPKYASIIDMPFLFERDEKFGGMKPKRTYYGFTFNDGFSDHLPVLLKLQSEN